MIKESKAEKKIDIKLNQINFKKWLDVVGFSSI